MAKPIHKTENKLRFRVTEDASAPAIQDVPLSNPADGAISDSTESATENVGNTSHAEKGSGTTTNATNDDTSTPRSATVDETNNPRDLLAIITDPHASEQAWVSACNELEKQKPITNRKAASSKGYGKLIFALISATVVSAGIGAAAFFHWGPFAPPQINFHPYMVSLQHEIRSHWHPPAGAASNKITIHFKIHPNGEISDVGFDRMSRLSEADAAALKAVIESMPALPPLPAGSSAPVDVQFHFDYNVNKNSSNSAPPNK